MRIGRLPTAARLGGLALSGGRCHPAPRRDGRAQARPHEKEACMSGLPWVYIVIGVVLVACCVVPMMFMKKHGSESTAAPRDDRTSDSDPKHGM